MEGTFSYMMRRLLWVPLILFVVSSVTFTLGRLGPGDPVRTAAGQFRDEEALERVLRTRGLDKPIYQQYAIYMNGVLTRGDLGESFTYQGRSITEVIAPAMWRSFQYNSVALSITLLLGIPMGLYSARRQGTWSDPATIGGLLFIQSLPILVIIPILKLIFALKLGLLTTNGWPANCNITLGFLGENYACLGVASREAIIPIIVLSVPALASWARYTRAFTLQVMNEDYVRTARSKGISEFRVMTQHVMRNSLLPLTTIIAFALIGLLEGSFFVETLTGIPGIGRLAVESIGSRDYDMIMAITMVGAVAFVMASIFIDIAYTFIDPRIRYGPRNR